MSVGQDSALPQAMAGGRDSDRGAKGADRVLAAWKLLARFPRGATLEQIAAGLDSPKSSTHRALATLRRAGLAEKNADGSYRLGFETLRLAFSYYEALDDHVILQPVLEELASRFNETAHYARLAGAEVVYLGKVGQADDRVHMGSRIGGRNPAHATGVGKMLLSYSLPDRAAVERYVREHHPLERRTEATICDAEGLHAELEWIRAHGYSVDREENELDVGCVALPVFLGPSAVPSGAVSVTTLLHRTKLESIIEAVGEIRDIMGRHLPLRPSADGTRAA